MSFISKIFICQEKFRKANEDRGYKMKCLVTGGAGFIGSHLVDRLIQDGHEIIVIDNLSTGSTDNINPKCKFYGYDCQDYLKIYYLFDGVDVVFHTAAMARTMLWIEQPKLCHDSNINGTFSVLMAAKNYGVKAFVYSSSCGVYGHQDEFPIKEYAKLDILTPYALSKYVGEEYCRLFSNLYRLPNMILRYANVYGTKRQSREGAYPNVLSAFVKQKELNGYLEITGSGQQTRDFIHVYDVVESNIIAMNLILNEGVITGFPINIGTGVDTSMN